MNKEVRKQIKEFKARQALTFAELDSMSNKIYSDRLAYDSTRFNVSKSAIQRALDSGNAQELRKFSEYFWATSGIYRRLVTFYASILTGDHLVIPRAMMEDKDYENKTFLKVYNTVLDYMEQTDPRKNITNIVGRIIRDGVYYGYEVELDNGFDFQNLPPAFCRTRFKANGIYLAEFDFSFFDKYRDEKDLKQVLSGFPPEFEKGYNLYKKDTANERWQLLDPEKARVHIIGDGTPWLASILLDIIDLEEYKSTEKVAAENQVYKILAQKIPIDKEGEVKLYMEEIKDIHKNARKAVKSNFGVLTAPVEYNILEFGDNNQKINDNIGRATDAVYTSAGTAGNIFNTKTSGSVGLNLAIKVDEGMLFEVLSQFSDWFNYRLKKLSRKYFFTVHFPEITIYNRKEKFDMFKEGSTLGLPVKLATMTALGFTQRETVSLTKLENVMLKLHEQFIPLQSAYNGGGVIDEGGAPVKDEVTDEGEATRDGDKNEGE